MISACNHYQKLMGAIAPFVAPTLSMTMMTINRVQTMERFSLSKFLSSCNRHKKILCLPKSNKKHHDSWTLRQRWFYFEDKYLDVWVRNVFESSHLDCSQIINNKSTTTFKICFFSHPKWQIILSDLIPNENISFNL